MKNFYPISDGGRYDATRAKLALFDEQTLRDIIDLVGYRGSALVGDIHRTPAPTDPPRILGILSPEYISYQDQGDVLIGLATIIAASLKKPAKSRDDYKLILSEAYDIPQVMAAYYADKIETFDKIEATYKEDASLATKALAQWNAFKDRVDNWAANIVNSANKLLGTGFYWDADQDRDVDFLFELSQLGSAVRELELRRRLISGQAQISANLSVLQIGDIGEGEDDQEAFLAGDIMRRMTSQKLPSKVMGRFSSISTEAKKRLVGDICRLAEVGDPDELKEPEVRARLIDKIARFLKRKPFLLGALGGVIPGLGVAKALTGDPNEGLLDEVYGDVASHYGEKIADAMLAGDIDTIVAEGMNLALDPDEYPGDDQPELFGDVDQELIPEAGGLFTRFRNRAAAKAAARRAGRTGRSMSRTESRIANKNQRQRMRMDSRAIPSSPPDRGFDEEENDEYSFYDDYQDDY
jgi:hypothetical protein